MKKSTLTFMTLSVCVMSVIYVNAQTANTSPLPSGETVIGGHLHAGSSNEVWSDATSLYFNYRGNASATHFWNMGNSTGKSIMTLLSNGNVGIGTTSPNSILDVQGQVNTSTLRLQGGLPYGTYYLDVTPFGSSGNVGYSLNLKSGGSVYNNVLNFGSNGYVGIGTTSPASLLHINSGNERNTFRIYKNTTTNNYLSIWQGDGSAAIDPIGTGSLRLGYDQSTNVIMGITGAGTISGNVGIGTTSPGGKLDINSGGTYAIRTSTSQRYVIEVKNTGDPNGGWWLVNDATGSFALHQNSVGDQLTIKPGGNVGIGTTNPGSYKLAVEGKIGAREVNVIATNPWPDYVFEKNYKLPSLEEIKNYIDQNQHLPEVPSAKEVEKNGVNLGEMNALLLKKIEELTLYVIELKKENESQQNEIQNLKNKK